MYLTSSENMVRLLPVNRGKDTSFDVSKLFYATNSRASTCIQKNKICQSIVYHLS